MKYLVHTDKDNYVISLELDLIKGIEVPDEVFTDQICWKYENGRFAFDEEKKHLLEVEKEQREKEEKLKPTVEDLETAINILTGIVLGGNN